MPLDHFPVWPRPVAPLPPEKTLERMEALLEKFGNPHHTLPPVVHVAGTNGKGSTIAFLRAMLEAAGYRVHAYTSPHVEHLNERFVLAGKEISDEALHMLLEECRAKAGDFQVSVFEGTTAAAMLAFSREDADVVLLETGCGGRFDATNILPEKLITIITPISEEHARFLGGGMTVIAWHKAGIMRSETPCVVANQVPEAMAVLELEAGEVGAPICRYGEEWGVEKVENGWKCVAGDKEFELALPKLPGDHQLINAGCAIIASQLMEGFEVPVASLETGLQTVTWPARLEKLSGTYFNTLIPENWELWVDAAHNQAAAEMLARFMQQHPDKENVLLIGISRGKKTADFLMPFKDIVSHIAAVKVQHEPESHDAEIIAKEAAEAGMEVMPCLSLEEALEILQERVEGPARVFCCGSVYLAADLKRPGK